MAFEFEKHRINAMMMTTMEPVLVAYAIGTTDHVLLGQMKKAFIDGSKDAAQAV